MFPFSITFFLCLYHLNEIQFVCIEISIVNCKEVKPQYLNTNESILGSITTIVICLNFHTAARGKGVLLEHAYNNVSVCGNLKPIIYTRSILVVECGKGRGEWGIRNIKNETVLRR